MANVLMPQKQSSTQSSLGSIGTVAGGVIGGIYGGPAGASMGASIGGAAGNALGGIGSSGGQAQEVQSETKANPSAIDRRISTLEDNPSVQLAKADAALKQAPPEIQQQYGPAIAAARKLDSQGGM